MRGWVGVGVCGQGAAQIPLALKSFPQAEKKLLGP